MSDQERRKCSNNNILRTFPESVSSREQALHKALGYRGEAEVASESSQVSRGARGSNQVDAYYGDNIARLLGWVGCRVRPHSFPEPVFLQCILETGFFFGLIPKRTLRICGYKIVTHTCKLLQCHASPRLVDQKPSLDANQGFLHVQKC